MPTDERPVEQEATAAMRFWRSPSAPPARREVQAVLGRALEGLELRYLWDQDGDLFVRWAYDEELRRAVDASLLVSPGGEVLDVVTTSDRFLGDEDIGRALVICNGWNVTMRWPTAYLVREETPGDDAPRHHLVTGVHVPLVGASLDAMPALLELVLRASFDFWERANAEEL